MPTRATRPRVTPKAAAARKPRVSVQWVSQLPRRPSAVRLRGWAEAVLAACGQVDVEVNLRLVDTEESQTLNAQYRGKDYATNVLSFDGGAPPGFGGARVPLGDLVICAPVVEREAMEFGVDPEARWAHMLVHGLLHLLGMDHEAPQAAAEMEALEIQLMQSLGFGNPYPPEEDP